MDSNRILSLLGLALRGGNLAVGEEPVEAVARARDARVLLLASDAADNTRRRVEHFAEAGQCLWLRIPFTKAELGRAVGMTQRKVSYLERGEYEPSLEDIRALCLFFRVSADYLLGFPKALPYPTRGK